MTRIQHRRDTSTDWTAVNPVLAAGEPAYETDTGKQKIGDGSTAWAALAYAETDLSGLAAVASSGAYADLTGQPTIPTLPTLATVATTGAYADLTGTPTATALTITDTVTEWWIYPVATYLESPYQRTVSGGISSTGKIVVSEYNHGSQTVRRYEVATAIVDDHCAPSLWAAPGRRMVVAWTHHNNNNNLYLKVSSLSGDLRSLVAAPTITYDLTAPASYTQIHWIAGLSDATQDTFWLFIRSNSTTWKIVPFTVTQSTGAVTFGSLIPLLASSGGNQVYISTADAHVASGNQIIRVAAQYNPSATIHATWYFQINCVTGAITSPVDGALTANTSGTNLPISTGSITSMIPGVTGESRRLFYVRPGPATPAVAYADWVIGSEDTAVYKVGSIDGTGGVTSAFDGLMIGSTGYASTPHHTDYDVTAGFDYECIFVTPATSVDFEIGRNLPGSCWARVTAAGNFNVSYTTSTGTVVTLNTSSAPLSALLTPGTTLGLRVWLNPQGSTSPERELRRYYSTNSGSTWTEIGTGSSLTTALLGTTVGALTVPTDQDTYKKVQAVKRATLKTIAGTVLTSVDFATDWPDWTSSYTDAQSRVWSTGGTGYIGSTTVASPATTTTTYGIAGPRVGYTADSNYVPGMAFPDPCIDNRLIVARSAAGLDTVESHVTGGLVETLASGATTDARLVRPTAPVNGGPLEATYTRMTSYSPTSYEAYQGSIRVV